MPYIRPEDRDRLEMRCAVAGTPGELQYLFAQIIDEYVIAQGLNYQAINDVLGALDGASKEFYRRIAVPYEDAARGRNGDVYISQSI